MKLIKISIFIILSSIILLSCAKKIEKYELEPIETLVYEAETLDLSNISQNHNFESQLQLLADNISTWKIPNEKLANFNGYCVTDLDNNGRLEVIVSQVAGTAMVSTNTIYEVNNTLTGLNLIKWELPEGTFGPNMMVEKCNVYIDNKDNSYAYIYNSLFKVSPYESTENKTIIKLSNGEIIQNFIGFKATTAVESNKNSDKIPEVVNTYTDSFGKVISEESYDLMEADLFNNNNYTSATATFSWLMYNSDNSIKNIDLLSHDELLQNLSNSYNEFHIILN